MQFNGVIEGFYGQAWSHADRLSYPGFLATIGCDTYVYAPKSDDKLRKHWQAPWADSTYRELQALSKACKNNGIRFGIGLTPLGALDDFTPERQVQLQQRLTQIQALEIELLCVLFDDIPCENDQLAAQQVNICAFIEAALPHVELIMCPTYYSTDPVLETHFGIRPDHYWQDLGCGLSPRWGVFWTGSAVVTADYTADDINTISQLLRRAPVLWDNYPVNDGKNLCSFLNLAAKSRANVEPIIAGLLHNPMNQAWCSQYTLAKMKGGSIVLAPALTALLERDQPLFQYQGLDKISLEQSQALINDYHAIDHPIAHEVIDWLNGLYHFDPNCLT